MCNVQCASGKIIAGLKASQVHKIFIKFLISANKMKFALEMWGKNFEEKRQLAQRKERK